MNIPSPKALVKYFALERALAHSRKQRARGCVASLMYHEVLPDKDPCEAWTVVPESSFKEQVRYLMKHFEILSMDQALERMTDSKEHSHPMVLLTFDDGYWGNRHVVWPIIEEWKVPITIFVSTSAVQNQTPYWYDHVIAALLRDHAVEIDLRQRGLQFYKIPKGMRGEQRWTRIQRLLADLKTLSPDDRTKEVAEILRQTGGGKSLRNALEPLTVDDIREMARSPYITFGAHTHNHDNLTQLSPEEARTTALQSKTLLEEWCGKPVRHFSYPFGAFNPEVAQLIEDIGFASSQATTPGFWERGHSAYAIPRIGISRFEPFAWFKARVSGFIR